jgi:hypothetical protein
MSPKVNSVRAIPVESTGSSSVRPIDRATGETNGDRLARVREAFELARQEAMADPSMRSILAALAQK